MDAPFVRRDVRAYLDSLATSPRPAMTAEFLAAMRSFPPEMMGALDLPVGELGAIRDAVMPGPAGEIALRLFDPRAERSAGPAVVYFHGGGFCAGSIDSHAGFTAEMARVLDLPVVSVDYRLAPEIPWPAAPDDAEAAARWVAGNAAAFGRIFTGLILAGDSAGADLAIITALALRERPAAIPVVMQVPIYPLTDGTRDYPSVAAFSDGYGLNASDMALFDRHYASDKLHWRASPLVLDQAGMPPTVLATASLDPLRDGGRAYAAKLIQSGVPVSFYEAAGMIHGFCSYRKVIPSAAGDAAVVLGLAKAMLGQLEAMDTTAR